MTSHYTVDSQTGEEQRDTTQHLPAVEFDAVGRLAVSASIASTMFCSQIAINIGEFPASIDFFCYIAFFAYLFASGVAGLRQAALLLFLALALVACTRMIGAGSLTSWSSLSLLLVLYAPFPFQIKPKSSGEALSNYIQARYTYFASIIAVIAVVQLIAVNLFKGNQYLSNISFVLPDEIRGAGTYAFFREGGGIVKANGYFLRESSTLSIVTSIALLLEFFSRRRTLTMCILAAGLLAAISGSGVLIILVAFLFPKNVRGVPVLVAGIIALAVIVTYGSDIPFLGLWLDRLSELDNQGSSGYARFVAPIEMLQRSFAQVSNIWFGVGAGSYLRTVAILNTKYEINDPTWAKLIYEYGFVGFTVLSALVLLRLSTSRLRGEIGVALFYAWISAGSVLKPDFVFPTWMLTLVRTSTTRKLPGTTASSREKPVQLSAPRDTGIASRRGA